LLYNPYTLSQCKLRARVLLTSCLECRACQKEQTRSGNDLVDVLIAPIPFLDFEVGGLDGVHMGIKPQRLDNYRSGLRRDTKPPRDATLHALDELKQLVGWDEHIPILFLLRRVGQP
jgi:hypothetical protein